MAHIYQNKAVFIAGPTASGKSAFALAMAEKHDGVIINADSMQVYADLRVLSARPSSEDESRVPHRLYGIVKADEDWSVALWLQNAIQEIKAAWAQGKLPILTGGTGLYFRALEQGLADIPDVPEEVREEGRAKLEAIGLSAFHEDLVTLDPLSAHKIKPGDKQRMLRAWEVAVATGTPLSQWQAQDHKGFLSGDDVVLTRIVAVPERDWLYARCNERAKMMVEGGAVEEVEALLSKNINPERPVMKALGVPELSAYLRGTCSLDDVLAVLQRNTRRYAKRQLTWFRNQCLDWEHRIEKFNVSNATNFFS